MKKATFSDNIKSTSASAFATDALALCNSSFKGTAENGSKMLPVPESLQQHIIFQKLIFHKEEVGGSYVKT